MATITHLIVYMHHYIGLGRSCVNDGGISVSPDFHQIAKQKS